MRTNGGIIGPSITNISGVFNLDNNYTTIKPSIDYMGSVEVITDSATYKFNGASLLDSDTGLYVATIHSEGAATAISSFSFDSMTGSIWVNQTTVAATGRNVTGIASYYYSGRTISPSIDVAFNGTQSRAAICLYKITNFFSIIPTVYSSVAYDTGRTTHSLTLNNTTRKSVGVACTTFSDAAIRTTYTNASEIVDKDFGTEPSTGFSSASISNLTTTSNLTVSVSHTVTSTPSTFGAVIWR